MTKRAIKKSMGGIVCALTLGFLIANWTTTGTSASTGVDAQGSGHTSAINIELQLSSSHQKAFDVSPLPAHQRPGPLASALQAGQGEKTVDQTRKNIQVLKGLPESQLFPVMNFIGSSLGVNCAYCHVRGANDQWEWEKDDKQEKVIARKMMQMQFDINKGNRDIFGTTGAVSCYTCHRGQVKPQLFPSLPQVPPAGGAAAEPAAPKADAAMPTVDQILDKYVQALGGRAALEKVKTRVWKGTQIAANGTSIPVEIDQEAPNKMVSILTTPKNGAFLSGFNGTVGWTKNQRGQRQLTGSQLDQLKRSSDLYSDLHLGSVYPQLRLVGKERIGEHEAYVLASQGAGNTIDKLYFDTQSGLLLRILSITQTLLAPLPEQTDFSDYREVDGIKLPFTIQQSSVEVNNGWTRKFTEVRHNVPVDEARFNPPAQGAAQ